MIKKVRQRPIAIILAFLMVFTTISSATSLQTVQAADRATLASWEITSAPACSTVLASSGTVSTKPVVVTGSAVSVITGPAISVTSGSAITTGAVLSTNSTYTATPSGGYASSAMKTTGWDNGAGTKYWQITLSSKGYENLTLAAKTRSSGTGPRDFKLQYSTDGINFHDTSVNYKNTTSLEYSMGTTVSIAPEASNSDLLIIRLTMSSNTSVGNSTVANTGVSNINSIAIQGTPVANPTIVGAVDASIPSGEILSTDLIGFTTVTTGAAITYSINDGAYNTYTAPFSITEFPTKIEVKATAPGLIDSVVKEYNYTQTKVAAVSASPNGGAIQLDRKIELSCSTAGATIQYSIDEGANWNSYTQSFTLPKLPAKVLAKATLPGAVTSAVNEFNYTLRTSLKYNLYFGQLHSHTTNSDGLGTVEEAFAHAANEVYNLDFLAVTDHSNSLEDTAGTANITNGSSSTKWLYGQSSANAVTTSDFVGMYGYEMTWSNGTGHINTFNTAGFENRNLAKYKTSTGLLEYYNVLKTVPTSISMFNHPGDTFGDFNDFAHYSAEMDSLISLIEVGNGEGTVHGSGYFPSYEYYTRALDKGWHVAPTNNQDNHKGLWGDANTARSVVLADSLTRENIYDAMKNMRVYATEDNNLNIYYTLDGNDMGSIVDTKNSTVKIKVELKDEGQTPAKVNASYVIAPEAIGKVEVIVNGGKSIVSKTISASEATVEFELGADYSYYYIRVSQADNDIAVTAPVWVGEVDKAGISETTTTTALPIKGEPIEIKTGLFNNESYDMNIKSLEYSINGKVIQTVDLAANALEKVASLASASYAFQYTSPYAGTFNVDVKLVAELKGVEKIFTDVLKIKITDPSLVTKIVVDGSHRNDYVNGYYSGNMTNFTALGAKSKIQVKVATEITDEVLAGANAFMISAPLKRDNFAVDGVTYNSQEFSDEFIAMVKRYVDKGGNLIICGIADYQDNKTKDASGNYNQYQTSTQLNKLLLGIGATSRINSDEVVDDVSNGGSNYRLYFTDYNTASNNSLLTGIAQNQKYSFYSGCSIILDEAAVANGTTTWLVKGHPTTYTINSSTVNPATPVDKGNVYALATEKLAGGGNMLIGGTVYTSNFEIQASEVDNYDDIYSNSVIISNLLSSVQKVVPTTTIAEARKGKAGDVFAVEGYVTAGTVKGNAFFDTIYIQDATGGMDIFPVSDEGILVGQKMRIIGSLDSYQGDIELRVISSEKISEEIKLVEPTILSTKAVMDYTTNGGKLVKTSGVVTEVITANGSLSAFRIKDSSGVDARVLVDGYILDSTGTDKLGTIIKVGKEVSVIGVVYYNPDGVNIRVRDRAEIKDLTPSTSSAQTPAATPAVTPTVAPITNNVITINLSTGSWKDAIDAVAKLIEKAVALTPGSEKPSLVINLPEAKAINAGLFKSAKGADINLVFKSTGYTWTINGASITDKIADLDEIDLTVATITDDKTEAKLALAIEDAIKSQDEGTKVTPIKEFSIAYDGALPFTGSLTLSAGSEYKNKVVFLSYYNEKTKKLESCGYNTVDADGNVAFTFKHASSYVISLENPILPSVIVKKTIYTGNSYELKATNLLEGDKVSFSSDKKTVATVDKAGKITAKKAGSATITTKVTQSGKTYTYTTKVTVKKSSITFSNKTTSIKVGNTFTFKTKLAGLKGDIIWSVSNKDLATITKKGVLKAKKAGTVKITAKCGTTSVSCKVKIEK